MTAAKHEAMKYLQQNHKKLWTRSQFGTDSKVDYVTNNLAVSFNIWESNRHSVIEADIAGTPARMGGQQI